MYFKIYKIYICKIAPSGLGSEPFDQLLYIM